MFQNQIQPNSDGAYAVETKLSNRDLLKYGLISVYRFQTLPNVVAIRQSDYYSPKYNSQFSTKHLAQFIENNKKNRVILKHLQQKELLNAYCHNAYCEAAFDNALHFVKNKHIILKPVQIAVIDSGVLASTSAIKKVLYLSSNDTNDTNEQNWLSHATMISSIFAGFMDFADKTPSQSYAPNARLHSIKITFAGDTDTSSKEKYGSMQLAVALDQAVASGAKIVNLSLTYSEKPDENIAFIEQALISAAAKKGVIFVAAAGNKGINNDIHSVYPASYNLNNLIVVGSHNSYLEKARSSNFGRNVDITAQGAQIKVNDKLGKLSIAGGTSFAVPLVASALSLYLGIQNPREPRVDEILNDLFFSSQKYYEFNHNNANISNYGRLNTFNFVKKAYYK